MPLKPKSEEQKQHEAELRKEEQEAEWKAYREEKLRMAAERGIKRAHKPKTEAINVLKQATGRMLEDKNRKTKTK